MRTFIAPAALALALLPLAACAAPGGNELAGTQWRFTSIDGAAPVSAEAHLAFERDSLGASAGCNGMGGKWRAEGGRIITGPLMQTEMYCDGPIWGQERAVSELLADKPRYTVAGDRLELQSTAHRAELQRKAKAR